MLNKGIIKVPDKKASDAPVAVSKGDRAAGRPLPLKRAIQRQRGQEDLDSAEEDEIVQLAKAQMKDSTLSEMVDNLLKYPKHVDEAPVGPTTKTYTKPKLEKKTTDITEIYKQQKL